MASSIALVFSKVVDPENPLYLDDNCREENIDWEFGLASSNDVLAPVNGISKNLENTAKLNSIEHTQELSHVDIRETGIKPNSRNKNPFGFKLVDPDEIVDPASLNDDLVSDEELDDNMSEDSDTSSDSSLQPYDLTDDDTDLKRRISQLVDVVGALRKTDDPDGVSVFLYPICISYNYILIQGWFLGMCKVSRAPK